MSDKVKSVLMFASVFISTICIAGAGALSLVAFMWARYDHDMKLIALTGVISIGSQMMATASTLLVGRAFSTNEQGTVIPNPLPAGTTMDQTTTLKTTATPTLTSTKPETITWTAPTTPSTT